MTVPARFCLDKPGFKNRSRRSLSGSEAVGGFGWGRLPKTLLVGRKVAFKVPGERGKRQQLETSGCGRWGRLGGPTLASTRHFLRFPP